MGTVRHIRAHYTVPLLHGPNCHPSNCTASPSLSHPPCPLAFPTPLAPWRPCHLDAELEAHVWRLAEGEEDEALLGDGEQLQGAWGAGAGRSGEAGRGEGAGGEGQLRSKVSGRGGMSARS